jgi:arsenite methyltransferase
MIVDKKIDLNIYKEREGQEPAASCCVSSIKVEKEKTQSCCVPSSTYCSTEPVVDAANALADLDFDEWVSKCHQYPMTLTTY